MSFQFTAKAMKDFISRFTQSAEQAAKKRGFSMSNDSSDKKQASRPATPPPSSSSGEPIGSPPSDRESAVKQAQQQGPKPVSLSPEDEPKEAVVGQTAAMNPGAGASQPPQQTQPQQPKQGSPGEVPPHREANRKSG